MKNAESVYEMYYHFEEPVQKLAGHRILALNRGGKRKKSFNRKKCRHQKRGSFPI